ncbi:MAG: hypothetical protein LBB14_01165 [Puniceicoccales bacterium]|jgi:hypothetical protein|nr:hypothetical protein [Puniceicoccales bacterium]
MRLFCLLPLFFALLPLRLWAFQGREPTAPHLPTAVALEYYARAGDQMERLLWDWSDCQFIANGRELSWQRRGDRTVILWEGDELPFPTDPLDTKPLAVDLPIAPFDLLCPFFSWPEPTYDGPGKMVGRRVQRFSVKNPDGANSPIAEVKIWLDASYCYPLAWEAIGRDGRPLRRFQLRSLKKSSDGHWTVRSLEFSMPQERKTVRVVVPDGAGT